MIGKRRGRAHLVQRSAQVKVLPLPPASGSSSGSLLARASGFVSAQRLVAKPRSGVCLQATASTSSWLASCLRVTKERWARDSYKRLKVVLWTQRIFTSPRDRHCCCFRACHGRVVLRNYGIIECMIFLHVKPVGSWEIGAVRYVNDRIRNGLLVPYGILNEGLVSIPTPSRLVRAPTIGIETSSASDNRFQARHASISSVILVVYLSGYHRSP